LCQSLLPPRNPGTSRLSPSQWDAEAHLTKVINGQSVAISTNTYNALGQRVRDVTVTNTTDEIYGAGGNLLWRYTGIANDPNDRRFVPFGGGNLAEYYSNGTPSTIFDHPDELGSATTSNDYTGNNFNEKLFYPYGELWTGAAIPSFNMHQTFGKLPDYDAETDEYNTQNRHYSPSGRWLTPDPGGTKVVRLDDPQTWNMYAYARNNPTTLTDPSGLFAESVGDAWNWMGGGPSMGPMEVDGMTASYTRGDVEGEQEYRTRVDADRNSTPQQVQKPLTAKQIQKQFYKQYGKAFAAAVNKVFGKDASRVLPQDISNAPKLDTTKTRVELKNMKGITDLVDGFNQPNFANYPAAPASAKDGTIFISSDLVKSGDMTEIYKTYAHELANLLDAQVNGMVNLERDYGDKNDTWDRDTGYQVEKTLFPQ